MSQWATILSAEEIEAHHQRTAKLDPRGARANREWWESRTESELRCLKTGAWDANNPDTYQMARSYLALRGVAS